MRRGCNRAFKRNAWKSRREPAGRRKAGCGTIPKALIPLSTCWNIAWFEAKAGLARARRTASSGSDDLGRSARLSPSPKRRGNRRCDKLMVGTGTPCSPAPPDERSRLLRAVGALGGHHGSAPSGGEAIGACRAFCPRECPRNSSRPSIRRRGWDRRLHATRPRESRVQGSLPSA